MSRTRIVKGKYTKIIGENYNISAEGNISYNAMNEVRNNGIDKGVFYGNYEKLGSEISDDFDIKFSLRRDKTYTTIVPFGILDYSGNYENSNFVFDYSLMLGNIDSLEFKILNEDGTTLYAITNLPEVVVSTRKLPLLAEDLVKNKPQYNPLKPVITWDWKSLFDPYNTVSSDYTKIGSYVIFWDGFDNNDVYDSVKLNNKKLKAVIIAKKKGIEKTAEVEFTTKYKEVDWVDVKIDRKNKKIDTTLRVNLKDGGEEGLSCSTTTINSNDYEEASQRLGIDNPIKDSKITFCDWDKISKEALNYFKKEPLKIRTKNFEELSNLALEGINHYWSRTYQRTNNKGTEIHGEKWEIIVNVMQDDTGMVAPDIIYFTNSKNTTFNRSHNCELHRELYYKVGYTLYPDSKNDSTKGWYYRETDMADLIFKETAAHEIGHQLLFEYGGRNYTYSHKGTSGPTWIQQDPLPGTKYPSKPEEIDLMKYAEENEPQDYHERLVLSQEDSLSIIWLTKLKILSAFLLILSMWSCQFNKSEKKERERVNFFNGIVIDDKKNPLSGVSVTCILQKDSSSVRTTITNADGYFKISGRKFEKLIIEKGAKLIFIKEGYVSDTVETTQPAPEHKKYPNNYFFIHKIPDTLYLKKNNFHRR